MYALKFAFSGSQRKLWLHRNRSSFHEPGQDRRPQLLTDVSVIMRHDAQTGIQRVVRAIWTNLREQSGSSFDAVPVFATQSHGYRFASPDFLSRPVSDRPAGETVRVQPGDKFLGLDLSAHLLPSYKRQISAWRANGATTHLVLHDLLPLQRPDWFNDKTTQHFKRWMEMVQNHCNQVLCVSDHVAAELRSYLGVAANAPAIGRIHLSGDIEGSHPSRGIDAEFPGIIERLRRVQSILMVGTIEPRKGYDIALAAFEKLWDKLGDEAPALVIVGKPGWRTGALQDRLRKHPWQGKRLFWLTNVTDEGLRRLYDICSGVFLASQAEGFGLPATEAAMHGRRALVRDLPVFRERQLPNISYFNDDRPAVLARNLLEFANLPSCEVPADLLPTWSDCTRSLVQEIGFGTEVNVIDRPAMALAR
jgi:glycosyltransferase involved in cell wall biosynthesis